MKRIIQIGTCDGNDHVYDYINSLSFGNIFAIFIEPNPNSIPLIKNKYQKLETKIISNIAISNKDGSIPVYFNSFESGISEHASCNFIHLLKHGHQPQNIKELSVACFTLNTYLNQIIGYDKTSIIDNLFIDTEGHDCDILIATDFSKLNIKQISFEFIHTDGPMSGMNTEKMQKTNEHLVKSGFKLKEILHAQHNIIYEMM